MLMCRSEDEACRGVAGYVQTVRFDTATQQCCELVFVLMTCNKEISINVSPEFLAWLKQPKLLQGPRKRSTEI